ncbi:MAG: opacity protein-like surface antigen [Planctomycetota bacterium]|jgi:hypothetical protein
MKKELFLLLAVFFTLNSFAQDDLMDILDAEEKPKKSFVTATFKTTKIVSSNSVETNGEGQLNFIIQHRFGDVSEGVNTFFGLDNSNIRIALEYGALDNIDIGIGRSSYEKKLDFFVKYRFLRQSKGAKSFPLTLAAYASMQINTGPFSNTDRLNYFSSRMSYAYQLMIARKFGKWVSVQLTPTMVHKNLVTSALDKNNIFSLGLGASVRVSGSVRLNLEYYWTPEGQIFSNYGTKKVVNAVGIGADIETGGHVFQVHIGNGRGMLEKELVAETTGDILKGQLHLGFNIARHFTIYDAKRMRQKKVLKKGRK